MLIVTLGETGFWTGSVSSEELSDFCDCDCVDFLWKLPISSGVLFTLPLCWSFSECRVPWSQFQTFFFWLSSPLSRLTILNSRFFLFGVFMGETLKKLVLSWLSLEVQTGLALTRWSIFFRVVLTEVWIDSTGSFFTLRRAETRKEVNSDSQSLMTVYPNPIIFQPTYQVIT